MEDRDAGLCPGSTTTDCTRRHRRSIVKQLEERRAATPKASVPDYMKRSADLKRIKSTWSVLSVLLQCPRPELNHLAGAHLAILSKRLTRLELRSRDGFKSQVP